MEGEINNFFLVWSIVFASLCYCYTINKIFPTGKARIITISPIILLFLTLPLNFTSIHFAGITSFFISWLATFKLIFFAFNQPPLSTTPPLPLSHFIPLACFPIKIQNSQPQKTPLKKTPLINHITKIMIIAVLINIYTYKQHIHPHIILLCYSLHMYFMLEMLLAFFAAVAKTLLKVELEPQFNEPYLATSLQDFWSKRWNLMVSNILYPTVYKPVRSASVRVVSRKWAPIPAVVATFLVSGLMHELIFYNIGRLRPNGEMMGFFVLHGASMAAEIVVKKMCEGKFCLPRIVSGPLTLAYVVYTSFWLFFPPFLRAKSDLRGCTESLAFLEFVRNRRLVGPSDVSCPFL